MSLGKDRNVVTLASINLPESVTQFVSVEKGIPVTSSLLVAEKFGVEHFNMLRTIDGLIAEDELVCVSDFNALTSEGSSDACFDCIKSTYLDERGRKQRTYLLTESGFMLVAMASKSEGAKKWRRQFVTAFQQLRSMLLEAANSRIRALTKPQESVWVPVYNASNKRTYKVLAPAKNYSEQQKLLLRKANALVHAKSVISNTRKWEKEFLTEPLLDLIPCIDVDVDENGIFNESVFASDLKLGKIIRLPKEAFKRSEYGLNKIKTKK